MTRYLLLLLLFGAFAAKAQSTNAPSVSASTTNSIARPAGQPLQAQTSGRGMPAIGLNQLKPNEMAHGKFVYSGITVEAVKKRNPLQLINPLASPEYGSPEDNLVRDRMNGRVTGLKIFAIRF